MRKETRWDDDFKKSTLKYMDCRFSSVEKPQTIEENDEIVENYGLTTIILTDEHIKALLDGKALNFNISCGEYAGLIIHQKSLEEVGDK